jgi:uncharacterized protein (UPF0276 family)
MPVETLKNTLVLKGIDMSRFKIGIAACPGLSRSIIENADYVELKKISAAEVSYYRGLTTKPLLFHMQFSGNNSFYMPTADDLNSFLPEISEAYKEARPEYSSFHFGLSSRTITVDPETNAAVAASELLSRDEIVKNLEKNLRLMRNALRDTVLLIENQEFIPDQLSRGAYRYISEADFFSSNVKRWNNLGILDGIVFDVSHALVTAANHPYYNDPDDDHGDVSNYNSNINLGDETYQDIDENKYDYLLTCFKRYIAEMPLELIREIHISGVQRLLDGTLVDYHQEIGNLELKGLKIILENVHKSIEQYIPLTLEYSRDVSKIADQLNTLREFCEKN